MSYASKEQIKELMEYVGGNLHLPQLISHFDKSMIFSEDEQMVGQWIDGKPMYQKIVTGLKTAKAIRTQETIFNISDLNIDTLITLKGIYSNTSNASRLIEGSFKEASNSTSIYPYLFLTGGNGEIQNVITVETETNKDLTLILCYTKTTDSALSYKLGTENDYSTEERLIGTWIDGKAIYQKTIIDTMPASGEDTKVYPIESNVDEIVDVDATIKSNGSYFKMFTTTGSWNAYYRVACNSNSVSTNPNSVIIKTNNTSVTTYAGKGVFITLKYTKV